MYIRSTRSSFLKTRASGRLARHPRSACDDRTRITQSPRREYLALDAIRVRIDSRGETEVNTHGSQYAWSRTRVDQNMHGSITWARSCRAVAAPRNRRPGPEGRYLRVTYISTPIKTSPYVLNREVCD
jgi:hypothetical protein